MPICLVKNQHKNSKIYLQKRRYKKRRRKDGEWRTKFLSISPPRRGRLSGGEGKTKKEEGRMENEEKNFSTSPL